MNPSPAHPGDLPPPGSSERWPWLQQLRRSPGLCLEPWLDAIETGQINLDTDLLAALADRLRPDDARRLLAWWLSTDQADPALLPILGRARDPALAVLLRQSLAVAAPDRAALLWPLLGHQREAVDFPLLSQVVRAPQPALVRRAALEGLAVGLSAWPEPPLRRLLGRLSLDLDAHLAATAVDLLARLPRARRALARLEGPGLDPGVDQRRRRRLAALTANPLVLVVHGRSGGVVPPECERLAAELEDLRGAPVVLQALTADPAILDPERLRQAAPGRPITLVPLLLLPGGHVRHDLPALTAAWRSGGTVERQPFLGAWPGWQRALGEELAAVQAANTDAYPDSAQAVPLLLHHPLGNPVAHRYLAHLERVCGARCLSSSYSAADLEPLLSVLEAPPRRPVLPLVLAANRLTEALPPWCGEPLLQRRRVRERLLTLLAPLP